MAEPLFGRLMTAMVTPFDDQGQIDHGAATEVARWLVQEQCNDALVINGTGGEAPTTSDAEKAELIGTVRKAIGPDVPIIAGIGTFNTAHSLELAAQATEARADGLLVVTPYYSKPPQESLLAHFTTIADAVDLPIVVYDIPGRSAVPVQESTLLKLAEHPRIVAVKDAKGDLASSGRVMAQTDLAYYSGEDNLTLPLLSMGGVGLIGTSTHFTGAGVSEMITAHTDGDHARALQLHRELEPVLTGVFATQGCLLVKAGLAHKGMINNAVRLPLTAASKEQSDVFCGLLDAAGL
ncbi:4-hydroxy-tetrahydrodipicolinate synthase [Naumannella halotolerans]|uniref:4-hydroxy-tetrahydrodipicolinate synthase n=1 Tax=Naumannella halotolerans TaxID=993414 RepID=UPI00370D0F06